MKQITRRNTNEIHGTEKPDPRVINVPTQPIAQSQEQQERERLSMPPVVEERITIIQTHADKRRHEEQSEDNIFITDPAAHEVINDLAHKKCSHKPQPASSFDDVIKAAAEVAMIQMNEQGKCDVRNEQRLHLLPQEVPPGDREVGTETRNDEECLDEIPHEERHLEVIKRIKEVIGDLDEGHRSPDEMMEHKQRNQNALGNVNIRNTRHN